MISKIAILTSKGNWFVPYAKTLALTLRKKGHQVSLFCDHKKISSDYGMVFILSYGRIIEKAYLERHRYNIVVHASDLPKGTGWAPLFWQILEGKKKIPFVLFDASENADAGDIYLKRYLTLNGDEIHDEIRRLEAEQVSRMCLEFLIRLPALKPRKQRGKRTYYARRTPDDSVLDIDKSIRRQFNSLRIASNKDYPAFFIFKGQKYVLHIHKASGGSHGRR